MSNNSTAFDSNAFPSLESAPRAHPPPSQSVPPPTCGRIVSLRDTFGFISPFHNVPNNPTRQPDIFFHFSDVEIPATGELQMNVGSLVEFQHTIQRDGKSKALRVDINPDLQTIFTTPNMLGRVLQDRRHRSLAVEVVKEESFESEREKEATNLPYSSPLPLPLILNASSPVVPLNSIISFTPTFNVMNGQLTAELDEVKIDANEWERFALEKEAEELGETKEWWGKVQRLGEKGGTINLCFPPPIPESGSRDTEYDEKITSKLNSKSSPIVTFSYSDVLLPDDDSDVQVREGTEVRCVLLKGRQGGWKGMKVKLLETGTIKTWKTEVENCRGRVVEVANDNSPNSGTTMIQRLDASTTLVPLPHSESPYSWVPSSSAPSSRSCRGPPPLTCNLRSGDVLTFELVSSLSSADEIWARDVRVERFATEWRERGIVASLKGNEGYGFIRTFNRFVDVYFRISDTLPNSAIPTIGSVITFDMEPQWKREGEMSFRGSRVFVEAVDGVENGENMVLLQEGLAGTVTKEPSSNVPGSISLSSPYTPNPDVLKSLHTSLFASVSEVADFDGRDIIVMPETLTFIEREVLKNMDIPGVVIHEANDGTISIEKASSDAPPPPPQSASKSHPGSLKSMSKVPFSHATNVQPQRGDIVKFDLYLDRISSSRKSSSGGGLNYRVEKLEVMEAKRVARASSPTSDANSEMFGFVTDVNTVRHFGFISAVDEEESKHVFFHLTEVVPPPTSSPAPSPSSPAPSSGGKFHGKLWVPNESAGPNLKKGDEVKFRVVMKKEKLCAVGVTVLPPGTIKVVDKEVDLTKACVGYVLLEPTYTSVAQTNQGLGRSNETGVKIEGKILCTKDPQGLFTTKKEKVLIEIDSKEEEKDDSGAPDTDAAAQDSNTPPDTAEPPPSDAAPETPDPSTPPPPNPPKPKYRTVTTTLPLPIQLTSKQAPTRSSNSAKRGDFVSFTRTKKGSKGITNIKVIKGANKAEIVKGTVIMLGSEDEDGPVLKSSTSTTMYNFDFDKVVSCEGKTLREGEEIEAILYKGEIFGIARVKDLYLTSTINFSSSASRPKLNLTVKSELKNMGGQIMAQSSMAAGPDGTIGFKAGWTKRLSKFVQEFVPSTEGDAEAEEVVEEDSKEAKEEDDIVEPIIKPTTELKLNSRAMQRF